MLRLSALLPQRVSGFAYGAAVDAAMTPVGHRSASNFVQRAAHLKRRFRGKGQFVFARAEAQRFLDAEVPKAELSAWMEQDNNAVALSQVMNFFEVEMQDAALSSLLLNKLVRTAESRDGATPALSRLEAVLSLMNLRPEENYERACATVDDVLRHLDTSPTSPSERWHVLDHCAKVLQRCGRRVTTDTNARLANVVAAHIQRTPLAELSSQLTSLLRIYAWMSRAEMNQADEVLKILMTNVGHMRAFELATLMASAWRHHQFRPLSVSTMTSLARDGLQFCTNANGHDIGVILGTVARLLTSAQQPSTPIATTLPSSAADAAATEAVTPQAIGHLADRFAALLEDYQPRVLDLMDADSALYWRKSEDIVAIAYAYELGGRARYRAVFESFQRYVQKEVASLEPTQLALTVGILHRSLLLSEDLLGPLSAHLEASLGELRLPELSHVCAALAATRPSWIGEAEAVALRLVEQAEGTVSPATYLQLALAFPQVPAFANGVDCTQMSARQLMDSLLAVLQSPYEAPVTAALVQRLSSAADRFTPDDVHLLRTCQRGTLAEAAERYLHERFAAPVWTTDTLFCTPLAGPNEVLARDVHKAMHAAVEASVSPELFVSLVELLTGLLGASEADVATFVRKGGADLLTGHGVLLRTIVRYTGVVRRYPTLFPSTEWLQAFTEKVGLVRRPVLRADEFENLLISLHTMYRNCQQTPALQVLLSELADVYYDAAGGKGLLCEGMASTSTARAGPSVATARATVLLAHLQQGMSLPLLTAATPTVHAVRQHVGAYAADIQQAVRSMPLPDVPEVVATNVSGAPPASQQLGRFTLKRRPNDPAPADHASEVEEEARLTTMHEEGRFDSHHAAPRSSEENGLRGNDFSVLDEDPFAMDDKPRADASTPQARRAEVEEAQVGGANAAATTQSSPQPLQPPQQETSQFVEGRGADAQEQAGGSYYVKFFHKTVGQILSGHRKNGMPAEEGEHDAPHAPHTQAAAGSPAAASTTSMPARRPHRTSLKPLASASSPGAPTATPTPTPTPTATATATATVTPVAARVDLDATVSASIPPTRTAATSTQPTTAEPVQESGASVFEKLFGVGHADTTPAPTTPASEPPSSSAAPGSAPFTVKPPHDERVQNPAATTFAQLFSSGTPAASERPAKTVPAQPLAASGTAMSASRLRGGHVFMDPSKPSASAPLNASLAAGAQSGRPPVRPRPMMSRRPGLAAPATAGADVSLDATSGQDGVVSFMNQAGLSKVTGYNVADAPTTQAAATPFAEAVASSPATGVSFSPQGGRLAWQETARQLARVTRRPLKPKPTRGRAQTSLSEWLSKPDATLQETEAATVSPTDAKGSDSTERGRRRKSHAPSAPTAAAAPVTATGASGRAGRKGTKTAKGAATPATVKGKKGGVTTAATRGGKTAKGAKGAKSAKVAKPAAKDTKKATAAAAATSSKKKAAKKPVAARKTVKKTAASAPKKAAAKPKPKPKTTAKPKAKAKGKKK